MPKYRPAAVLMLLAILSLTSLARAEEISTEGELGRLVRSPVPNQTIQGLHLVRWTFEQIEAPGTLTPSGFQSPVDPVPVIGIKIEATYNQEGWSLVWNGGKFMQMPANKPFTILVPLVGELTPLTFKAIRATGEISNEKAFFRLSPSAWSYLLAHAPTKRQRPYGVAFAAGLSFVHYQESPLGVSMNQFGITPKVTGIYNLIPNKLDLALNTFVTAFPVYWSPLSTIWARFYGINGRVGYTLPWHWAGGTYSVMLGWYFWGMFVQNNQYGLAGLTGPQILLSARVPLRDGRPIWGYIKYAPLNDGASAFDLNTFEIAAGGGFQFTRSDKSPHPLAVTLDVSYLTARDFGIQNVATSYSVSLGVQMTW